MCNGSVTYHLPCFACVGLVAHMCIGYSCVTLNLASTVVGCLDAWLIVVGDSNEETQRTAAGT